MARSHGGARQGVEGVPPSVRPTRTKLDYDRAWCVRFFGDFLARTKKMDSDRSVVFAYDGVPAHLDLAIPAPFVHPVDIVHSSGTIIIHHHSSGSILGPLLFSIYVNDLPEAPRNCSTECYVDDRKLFVSFHSQDTGRIVEEMNEDLLGVRNWCFRNRPLLNPDKTKLIVFGSRQMTSKLHDFRLSLLGKDISPVQSAKDLGVILDSNLTFDDHNI